MLYEKYEKLQAKAPHKMTQHEPQNEPSGEASIDSGEAPINKQEPKTIAHRGGANLWPENTLEAFEEAIKLGVHGIEFDLQLSKDGHLMVHHDSHLKPVGTRLDGTYLTAPTPRLDTLTAQQLQAYDVGRLAPDTPEAQRRSQQSPRDGARIPYLNQLEHLSADAAPKGFQLYAELKTDMTPAPAQAEALADAYLAALDVSCVAAMHRVISFDWRCLERVRARRPETNNAYTTLSFASTDPSHARAAQEDPKSKGAAIRAASRNGAPWWGAHDWRDQKGETHGERVLRAIGAAGGQGWIAYWRDVTPDTMAIANELGLKVSAWTVNEAADMKNLAAMGVEALITDRPDRALALHSA